MLRRQLTFGLAIGLSVVLVALAFWFPVPYVSLAPGPAIDTLGKGAKTSVLTVTGARTYPSDGMLALTTVSVQDRISLLEALRGWVSNREAVVPREFLYPEDQTPDEVDQQNVAEMKDSQGEARLAALGELGLLQVTVRDVTKGSRALGLLQRGDVLVAVDGTAVRGPASLRSLVRSRPVGAGVRVQFRRKGVLRTVRFATVASPDKPPKAALGITTELTSPIKVAIVVKDEQGRDVGGPSAGLMLALGIIEKLGPGSLTGGTKVAGTGTISTDGTVGPIGGIAEKLIGAKEKGATVFLAPAGNCPEAKSRTPDGITLAKVATLRDALRALADVRAGRTPKGC